VRPKILLIDNYDSFTYNLVQAFLVLGAEVDVHRNDALTVDAALRLDHSHLVISQDFQAGRYHSLIAEPQSIPDVLEVTARTAEGEIMGVRHKSLPIEGVQFHPESVLTPEGPALMGNFLKP